MSKDFTYDVLVCPFIKKILSKAHKENINLISVSVERTNDVQVAVLVEYFICLYSPKQRRKLLFFPKVYFNNVILNGSGNFEDLTSDQSLNDVLIHFRLKHIGIEVLNSL